MTSGYRRAIGILITMLAIELVTLACLTSLNSNLIGGPINNMRTVNTVISDRIADNNAM